MLEHLDDSKVFYYFEEISNVPRGSEFNQLISNYLVEFAKQHSFEYVQDEAFNVIIKKPASSGYETCEPVILQGHMDMVCEKECDVQHDFTKQGLELEVEDDYIFAKGTTLGADDGIALAITLAILTDDTILHPPLEAIFTVDEEIGMIGADKLDTSGLLGKYLINIDSEEEGIFLTSCAGGMTLTCELPLTIEKKTGIAYELQVSGLQGGHSGTDIHKHRVNATNLLGRLLFELNEIKFDVTEFRGGSKDNVITREATAYLLVEENQTQVLEEEVIRLTEKYKTEYNSSEQGLTISTKKLNMVSDAVYSRESYEKIIFFLVNAPVGVQVMSSEIDNLVESSLNLGIFFTENEKAVFSFSIRSSKKSYKEYMCKKVQVLIEHLGGSYQVKGDYPAWEYNKDSKIRDICMKVYRDLYEKAPQLEAIHAGLECGVLADKIKDLDIISLGPEIFDIHTPKEKLSISSTKRVYQFLKTVLYEMCACKNQKRGI